MFLPLFYFYALESSVCGFHGVLSRFNTALLIKILSLKFQPTAERTITALSNRKNSKSIQITTSKKVTSRPAADLSKRKEDKVSAPENIPSVVSQVEPAHEEDISISTIQRRKSDRRNSFISSLMSRSKVLVSIYHNSL